MSGFLSLVLSQPVPESKGAQQDILNKAGLHRLEASENF